MALIATGVVPAAQADEPNPEIHGPLVLANATIYDPSSDEIRIDRSKVDHTQVSDATLNKVETGLKTVPDETVNEVLKDNGLDPEETRNQGDSDVSIRIAPAIIWGGAAIPGIIAGGGLIFYAMYTTHEEKMQLVNRCYDEGGTPVVSSQDSAGVEGTTDSGAAQKAGGYRFECQK